MDLGRDDDRRTVVLQRRVTVGADAARAQPDRHV